MSSKKLSAEEELEKQYRDYKAQFEQWKEKNKSSEGTEAYEKYVQQFRDWERDVEKRRATVRQKALHDKHQAEKDKVEKEEEERRKQDEAAKSYAEQQKQYFALHQRGMQEDDRQRARHAAASQAVLQAHAQSGATVTHAVTPKQEVSDAGSMLNVMQQMMALMGGEQKQNGEEAIKSGPHIQADPQPAQPVAAQPQEHAAPPQLWGADGANYTPTDPLFVKWNVRAAPPNFKVPYQPPPPGTPIVPGWLLIQEMQANSLIFPPPPPVPSVVLAPPPMPVQLAVPPPVPNFAVPPPVGMPPMNVPPPSFSIS